MSSLNKVMIIGRMGKDPESRDVGGSTVCSFSLATDESYKDRSGQKVEKTEWHNVQVWGQPAQFVAQYGSKGRLVFVEGSLQTRRWQAQDGSDRFTTEVKAQRVNFLDKSPDAQEGGSRVSQPQGRGQQPRQQTQGGRRLPRQEGMEPDFAGSSGDMDSPPF